MLLMFTTHGLNQIFCTTESMGTLCHTKFNGIQEYIIDLIRGACSLVEIYLCVCVCVCVCVRESLKV